MKGGRRLMSGKLGNVGFFNEDPLSRREAIMNYAIIVVCPKRRYPEPITPEEQHKEILQEKEKEFLIITQVKALFAKRDWRP